MPVFDYIDYRMFLKEHYRSQKSRDPSYSFRVFANRAKLASPNYLKLVIDGKRRITDRNLENFIRGLGLSGPEARYFRGLVSYQEATDLDEKKRRMEQLLKIRRKQTLKASEIAQESLDMLSSWHHWVIREMVLLQDFIPEPAWISRRLRNKISAKEALDSLQLLEKLGFVKRNPEGRMQVSDPLISTSDERASLLIRNLHRQFIELGIDSLLKDPLEQREINGLTLAVPKSRLPELKNAIKNFRKELNRAFSGEADNDEVYHLVVHLFPVTGDERKSQ